MTLAQDFQWFIVGQLVNVIVARDQDASRFNELLWVIGFAICRVRGEL